jgi:hypothetical protein
MLKQITRRIRNLFTNEPTPLELFLAMIPQMIPQLCTLMDAPSPDGGRGSISRRRAMFAGIRRWANVRLNDLEADAMRLQADDARRADLVDLEHRHRLELLKAELDACLAQQHSSAEDPASPKPDDRS